MRNRKLELLMEHYVPFRYRWVARPLCWLFGHDWIGEGELCWEHRFRSMPREYLPQELKFDEACQRWSCLTCEQWVENHPETPGRFPRSKPDPFDRVYKNGAVYERGSGKLLEARHGGSYVSSPKEGICIPRKKPSLWEILRQ